MQVIHKQIEWLDIQATAGIGCFNPKAGAVAEYHAIIELKPGFSNAQEQFLLLEEAALRVARLPELNGATLVWKHFFVSDAINQSSYITASADIRGPVLNPEFFGTGRGIRDSFLWWLPI